MRIFIALFALCCTIASAQVIKQDSEFDKSVVYQGQQNVERPLKSGGTGGELIWLIRAWVAKDTGIARRQVYVSVYHGGPSWRFFNTASFSGGDIVPTTRIDATPLCSRWGCSYSEVVGIPLTDRQWATATASGLDVRLNAQKGEPIQMRIEPAYAAQMNAAMGM